MDSFIDLTEELYHINDDLQQIYLAKRESGEKGDFYLEVKPYADKVKRISDEWGNEALKWISTKHPKYIHPMQIQQTMENFELVSVQAFFPETSFKRFQSYHQSIQFILKSILDEERR
ncbi:YppE family protein [Bacillus sp. 2205SS5-2]|uniref:YppE family protein n=1 Tax=Bacillus sp. 2205SS5-2 TaxID=3109031 RepID=UPI0030076870